MSNFEPRDVSPPVSAEIPDDDPSLRPPLSPPVDWVGLWARKHREFQIDQVRPPSPITPADLNALDEGDLRAIIGNAVQVANYYPGERTAGTLLAQIRHHVSETRAHNARAFAEIEARNARTAKDNETS